MFGRQCCLRQVNKATSRSGGPAERNIMRSPRIPMWARLAAAAIVTVPAAAGCSSASSSSTGAASASGTGNTVNSTWPTTITLGSVGEDNATSLMETLQPLQDLMKAKMDVTLKVTVGTSYAAMIEAQEAGKAQMIVYGPFSYWIALNHGLKIQNVGLLINEPGSDGGYYSEAVV